MLDIVHSTGETVLTRAGEVPPHTEFMVYGADIRTSILSEAIALGEEVQGTGGAHGSAHGPTWGRGG